MRRPSPVLAGAMLALLAWPALATAQATVDLPVVLPAAVVDDGGNLMYLERLQPTFPMGATISTEKARTAALFQKPTKILEDAIVGGRTPLLNVWSAPLNGGEPIVVDGQVVGAVGVSGASSAARDAAIAIVGAAALGTKTSASR